MPFTTAFMGENHFAAVPLALDDALLLAAVSYTVLQQATIRSNGTNSVLRKAVGADTKGKLSLVADALALPAAFWSNWLALGLIVLVALTWFVPDRRIERMLAPGGERRASATGAARCGSAAR